MSAIAGAPERPGWSSTILALRRSVFLYIGLLAAAEGLVAFGAPLAGAVCHAALLCVLLGHFVLANPSTGPTTRSLRHDPVSVLPALALVPMLRLVSLALATDEPGGTPYIVGAVVVLGAIMCTRLLGHEDLLVPPPAGRRRGECWIAAAGAPLSLLAYLGLEPAPLSTSPTVQTLGLAAVAVFLFGGVGEELIFRGLLQRTLCRLFGTTGVLMGAFLYACVYAGTGSLAAWLFFAVLGISLAFVVQRTGSIAGVAVGHGLLNVGLIVLWPTLLG